jgi:protein-tyrosine phosphatase
LIGSPGRLLLLEGAVYEISSPLQDLGHYPGEVFCDDWIKTMKQESTTMTARTSEIYPLIINEVLVPGCPGAIGITFCPGKKDRHSNTGIWERDLEADMESIRAWGTTCLVTLMEDHEFDQLGVRQLPFKAQEVGLTWFHIPIPDVSIPDFRFHERWSGIGLRLMNVLLAGEKVVVHCRGGLGRSGIVAALLLIEAGMDSREAVDMVRAARQGAIETIQQEAYVRGYRAMLPVERAG